MDWAFSKLTVLSTNWTIVKLTVPSPNRAPMKWGVKGESGRDDLFWWALNRLYGVGLRRVRAPSNMTTSTCEHGSSS
jgi:hypothetical protein